MKRVVFLLLIGILTCVFQLTTAYAQGGPRVAHILSPYQEEGPDSTQGDSFLSASVRTTTKRTQDGVDSRAAHDVRATSYSKLGHGPYEPWPAMRTEMDTPSSDFQPDDPEGMDPNEEKARVDPENDSKPIIYNRFLPTRSAMNIMQFPMYQLLYSASLSGRLPLWNIAMTQTEPAIAAGAHNSIMQAQTAVANVISATRLNNESLPGNPVQRDWILKQYYGCVSGENVEKLGDVNAYLDCMNDLGGTAPVVDNPANSTDVDPDGDPRQEPDDTGITYLSDVLFSHVIANSDAGDERDGYIAARDDYIKWFGDIQWRRERIERTTSGGNGNGNGNANTTTTPGTEITTTRINRGADVKRIVREIARDRYYLLVSLIYVGCLGRNLNGTDVYSGGFGVPDQTPMYPLSFLNSVANVTSTILTPGSRAGAWGALDLTGGDVGQFRRGEWVPATGSADYNDIWAVWANSEVIRKLSIPEVPLQGITLDAFVMLHARTRKKAVSESAAITPPDQVCDVLDPEGDAASLDSHNNESRQLDIFSVYYRYAKFVATMQVVRAFHEAILVINDLKNIEEYYKQVAYEQIFDKLGADDIGEVLRNNVMRMQAFITKVMREDISPRNSRKGFGVMVAAREKQSGGETS